MKPNEFETHKLPISVIVPCYNVEAYLDRAMESLSKQTFRDFEIVAIDDGSTDDTTNILQAWLRREPRLRMHRQENKGLYLARLAGIEQARGEWITFMDADDEITPDHLATLWAAVREGVDVVVTGIIAVKANGELHEYGPAFSEIDPRTAVVELLTGHHSNCLYSCWNKLYRHALLKRVDLHRPRINYGEDQVFNLRVFRAAQGSVVATRKSTYRYISRPGSIMRSVSLRHVAEFFDLWRERDQAAASLQLTRSELARYARMKTIALFDFSGVVYRSGEPELVFALVRGLDAQGWRTSIPGWQPVLILRWLKWKARMTTGVRGWFPKLLGTGPL